MPEIEKVIPTELDGNSRYAIRIKSVNSFGIASGWSETLIVDTEEAGAPTGGRLALTANGLIAYDSNGQLKMVYSGEESSIRINEVTNPSFGVNTVGWAAFANTTLIRSEDDYYIGGDGYGCGQVTCTVNNYTGVGFAAATAKRTDVSPGDKITASAYVKAPIDPVSLKVAIQFYDGAESLIKETSSYSARIVPADGNWYRIFVIGATVPNLSTRAGFAIYSTEPMNDGQIFYVDGILMEESETLNDYFDGSTSIGATEWGADPHDSNSVFNLTASYYVDGGVFTAGTLQTAVDVGEGDPFGKAGVKMSTTGIQGYSGSQATPSFSLDTVGKFRVGGIDNFIYWDGTTLTVAGTLAAGVIDIGGFDSTSFHVDATGQMWMGAATYATAPLKISSSGDFYASSFNLLDPEAPSQTAIELSYDFDWSAPQLVFKSPTNSDYSIVSNPGLGLTIQGLPRNGVEQSSIRINLEPGANSAIQLYSGLISNSSPYDRMQNSIYLNSTYGGFPSISTNSMVEFDSLTDSSITTFTQTPVLFQFEFLLTDPTDGSGVLIYSGASDAPSLTTDGTVAIGGPHLPSNAMLHVHETDVAVSATIHLTHASAGSAITDGLSIIVTAAGVGYVRVRENNDLRLGTNNTDRFYIASTGELRATADGTLASPIFSWTGDTDTGIYRNATNSMAFSAGNSQMLVVANGLVSVNLAANAGETASVRYAALGGLKLQASNRDLKDNIQDFPKETALKLVNELRPKSFTWKPLDTDTPEEAALRPLNPSVGFIAEDVAEIGKEEGINFAEWRVPSNPKDIKDIHKWEVSYWKEPHIITLLVGAVQELTEKIKKLENKK
jgi:hypothetical protein